MQHQRANFQRISAGVASRGDRWSRRHRDPAQNLRLGSQFAWRGRITWRTLRDYHRLRGQ
jgi:hypothetical protein